ncbi:MAG: transketolase [Acidobacteria bacterium]|nr:transketolase [Acidobacteriota bacterium]
MGWSPDDIDRLCVNTIRTLSIDAVQKADSGHPGLPLGAAPMAYVLWQRHLRFDPADPRWPDRDRFVLSAGHGSMLLYALLHLAGFDVSLDDIRQFRQWESRTPGHPEAKITPGVEATTGPLGQGSAEAVGMAIAERILAGRYNRPGREVVDHVTYALVSDGDLMEGISAEAGSLAGHLRLGKLIYLYDSNSVTLDAPTSVTFTEDVAARYRAYGWQVLEVFDGDTDLVSLDAALREARSDTARPSLVVVRTTIGYGSPNKAGTYKAHGAPLGAEEVALTKKALGWDPQLSFHVPDAVRARFAEAGARGAAERRAWQQRADALRGAEPALAAEWEQARSGKLPEGWDAALPSWKPGQGAATREASGKALNAIAERVPWLVGGDADLAGSTKTRIDSAPDFASAANPGRNLRFGVREHAMAGIANGIAFHGGLRPYVSTFFVFSDYMRPPLRLAALDSLPVIYVFTHDSLGVGEDGPTHQPVEQLAALRAMPGLYVVRPGDPNETAAAWRWVMSARRPAALVMTRQKLPALEGTLEKAREGVARGAYVLADAEGGPPQAIVIATGSELQLAMAARAALAAEGVRVRVVSMPCWEIFDEQDAAYREQVLPAAIRARVSVEAATPFGWSRWVGERGTSLGVERFGASAPGDLVLREFGFTSDHVVAAIRHVLS